MATADPAYNPALSGSTPPVVFDGTGLTTTVPLLIKNGKAGSGVEVQVTSTVRTGFLVNDSAGTASVLLGYAVSANDWITGSAAGDTVIGCVSTKIIRIGAIGGANHTVAISPTNRTLQLSDSNSSAVLTAKDSATIQGRCNLTNNAGHNLSVGVYGNANTVLGVTGNSICEVVANASSVALLLYTAGNNPTIIGANTTERIRVNGTGIGFFVTTPAAQQTSGANLTNSVTSGGTDDTIANFTDLTTYATDAAAIRNDIYQLARKLKQVNDALRLYGLLT